MIQMACPKTKSCMRVGTRVKGMQNEANKRSLMARLRRKMFVIVLMPLFWSSVRRTRVFPVTLRRNIRLYRGIVTSGLRSFMRAPPPIGGRTDDVTFPFIAAISSRKFDVIDDADENDDDDDKDDDLSNSCCPRIKSTRNSANMEEFVSLPLKLM